MSFKKKKKKNKQSYVLTLGWICENVRAHGVHDSFLVYFQAKQATQVNKVEAEMMRMKEEMDRLRTTEEVAKVSSNKVLDLEVIVSEFSLADWLVG